jgi:hypothetical protein
MKTLQEMAIALNQKGYDYGAIATTAIIQNLSSFNDAIIYLYGKYCD